MLGVAADLPIIDAHIHLFDPARPQGVPWPPKDNARLYRSALPSRYRALAAPLGIVGAFKVEASPWIEDNDWVLDIAGRDPIIVGVVGNLEPGTPEFRHHLERLARNPLFRGIRYGALWERDFPAAVRRPDVIADLGALAAAGLAMDSAPPSPAVLTSLLLVADKLPGLRIIVDHLPQLDLPAHSTLIRELAGRTNVFVKVSEVVRRVDGRVPLDLSVYRARLDVIFDTFGQDRLIFGSDWPNSDNWASLPQVVALVREYFTGKGHEAAAKYFWRNSIRAYRWSPRDRTQPRE
jgi:predicted TIM-barrel fold metal-dependent hydrolase